MTQEEAEVSLRIYTLGRFTVVKYGVPLRFERKAQKRPLELLQALIALGGRDVSQILLEDALWPEASGKSARQCFNMALHRLRKLVGSECLLLENSKLTLNPHLCWVDVWEARRRLHDIESALAGDATPASALESLLASALSLLHGPFLEQEADQPWMHPLREKLRHQMRRLFSDLSRHYGRQGRCEQAIAVHRKALEIDPLAEEFYRRLMICYAAHERRTEALAAYHYCRRTLHTCLQSIPSLPTEDLLRAIQQEDHRIITAYCTACRTSC